jgi:6-phosphogluconolactonase/glucosamine-6-phosphate isomerase/deaminase
MKQIIVKSLAEPVGELWKTLQSEKTDKGLFIVSSPLSSTPLPIYEWVIDNAESFSGWKSFRFVLMDEMLKRNMPFEYVPTDDPASYEGFAKKHLLDLLRYKVDFDSDVMKPHLNEISTFNVPIDLLILALGVKGNYANVMPGTSLETGWHIAKLIPEFRQAHTQKGSHSYEGADFREYGMSLGPQQVLAAKNVVVIISGEKKRELTKQLLSYDAFNPEFPLSIIHNPNVADRVSVYMTEDAL